MRRNQYFGLGIITAINMAERYSEKRKKKKRLKQLKKTENIIVIKIET